MQVQQTPNVKEIGNSINSMNLEYAEITKYSNGHNTKSDNEEDKIILTKIKFFFMRHSHLISIQYVYQQKKIAILTINPPSYILQTTNFLDHL